MTRFEVHVAAFVDSIYDNREEAEKRLNELRHSFYALVHVKESFYIKEVKS